MFREDYIMRSIEQLGKFMARLLELKEDGDYDGALDLIDGSYGALLEREREFMDLVDIDTLIGLVHDPERLRALCRVMEEEALLWDLKGEGARADARRRQARAIEAHLSE